MGPVADPGIQSRRADEQSVRVAVVQDAPVVMDRERCLDKVADLAADAARQGAKLVLFPEAFVSGYPRGLDFGAVVGARSPEGREQFRLYWESAVEAQGSAGDRLSKIARQHRIFLVVGVIEREGGTLYCSVFFYDESGRFLGKHRKLMPTGSERLIWGFGDGSTLPVFDTTFGRVGAVICWENYMPLLRQTMYAKGIQIYCAPTADARDVWAPSMRHIALEGRCFVLSANQFIRRGSYPKDYVTSFGDDPETVFSPGGSCIVGPLGQMLAEPNFEGPAILIADLDLRDCVRGKFDFDVVGHYARPDIFKLTVNGAQARSVSFSNTGLSTSSEGTEHAET